MAQHDDPDQHDLPRPTEARAYEPVPYDGPSRADHLAWAKQRALEYVDAGDTQNAFTSLISDLGKHPETIDAARNVGQLGMMQLMGGMLNEPAAMRKFIEDVG